MPSPERRRGRSQAAPPRPSRRVKSKRAHLYAGSSRVKRAQQEHRLASLQRATLAIAGDLDLRRVLQRILGTAARLVGARYGALGIPDGRGGFGRFLTVGISEERARRIGNLPRVHGVLGALITQARPIRTRDIRRHPLFGWYPAHHPELRDFLGVPIRHRGEVLGNLFLAGSRSGAFSAADQRLVTMLAAHAGVAIATARLFAKAQELAVLQERTRLARELHDAVAQSLFSIVYGARAAALQHERRDGPAPPLRSEKPDQVAATSPQPARDGSAEALRRLEAQAAGALQEMRGLVFALRPKSLEQDGLDSTLADHIEGLRRSQGAAVEFHRIGERSLTPSQELALLRIGQEAVRNALWHGRGAPVTVELHHDRKGTRLSVRDSGPGFDPATLPRTERTFGLQGMRERAGSIGARFSLAASPGGGCRIEVLLPLRPARQPRAEVVASP
jgi:signal transduction histidine kinase